MNSGAVIIFSNMELRLPGAQVGVAFMFMCGASRSQRLFGSSISHWSHACGQFTIIHPGLRSHSPLRASILHRRERSWHALLSTFGTFVERRAAERSHQARGVGVCVGGC